MTGIVINGNEYQVNTGLTKIEYASMGPDTVGYSMYGDDIPLVLGIINFKAIEGTGTFTITKTDNYRLVLVGGGAGGCVRNRDSSTIYLMPGSAGGVFDGIVRLEAGDYTYSIGSGGIGSTGSGTGSGQSGPGGDTTLSFDNSVIATVGGAGYSWWSSNGEYYYCGAGGTKLSGSITVVSSTVNRYGNTASRSRVGSSLAGDSVGAEGYSPDSSIEERGTGGSTSKGTSVCRGNSGVGGLLWIINL